MGRPQASLVGQTCPDVRKRAPYDLTAHIERAAGNGCVSVKGRTMQRRSKVLLGHRVGGPGIVWNIVMAAWWFGSEGR